MLTHFAWRRHADGGVAAKVRRLRVVVHIVHSSIRLGRRLRTTLRVAEKALDLNRPVQF